MNAKVLSAGSRTVRRHPGKAFRVSLFAIKRRRALLMVMNTTRRAMELGAAIKEAAANPRVQTEASSAVSSLMLAGKRARRVGVAKAPSDKQVAAQLRRAGRHASKAVTAATHPKRARRVVRTTTIVTGAGALGGAAYAGWRVYARPVAPDEAAQFPTIAPEPITTDESTPQTQGDAAAPPPEPSAPDDGAV